jgi:hypothetical protein
MGANLRETLFEILPWFILVSLLIAGVFPRVVGDQDVRAEEKHQPRDGGSVTHVCF